MDGELIFANGILVYIIGIGLICAFLILRFYLKGG